MLILFTVYFIFAETVKYIVIIINIASKYCGDNFIRKLRDTKQPLIPEYQEESEEL